MEKEHNRGQEGAGVGCVRIDATPGEEYIFRERAQGPDAIRDLFASIGQKVQTAISENDRQADAHALPFEGEVYMGHLRYSTTGRSGISYVHPFMRRNNWSSRNLLLCGNFNMTNVDEIFNSIISTGSIRACMPIRSCFLSNLATLLTERTNACLIFIMERVSADLISRLQ